MTDFRSGASAHAGVAPVVFGTLAGLTAATIWGGWIVATRAGVTGGFTPVEIAIIRTLPPALILFPLLFRLQWRRLNPWRVVVIVAGAGAPYFLIASTGTRFAPVSDVGALLPGTMPLFAAILAVTLLGGKLGRWRLLGFALIIVGGLAVGGDSLFTGDPGEWRGHLLFLCAAAMWAAYTIALRGSGLDAWQAAAIVGIGSVIVLVPVGLIDGDVRFDVPWRDIAVQVVAQGLGSGLFAMAAYGMAVSRLGASNAAAFSALTPVIATIVAVPALGELPPLLAWAGVIAVCCGVALASGVLRARS